MDLNAACAGFTYGLVTAAGLVGAGMDRVLLIGAETLTRATNWEDRSNAFLFGDGAGAVVVEAVPGEGSLLGWDLGVDGTLVPLLYADHGSGMVMRGQEVFRKAVRVTVESAQASMERAKVSIDDIALFVPHQANLRIMDAAASRLGLAAGSDRLRHRPNRQHQFGLDTAGPGGCGGEGPAAGRRPDPARRVRRRHDLGVSRMAMGRCGRGRRRQRAPPG